MATEQERSADGSPSTAGEGSGRPESASSPRDDPGEPDLYPGERDGTNESLRAERDFWKHLFDSMVEEFPEAVLIVDDEGTLTHWNPAHEEIANVPAEEALGRKAYDVLGTDGESETLAEEIARRGVTIREEKTRSTVDPAGNRYHIRCSGTPLRSPDGEVGGAFELVSQVTALVEQREKLEGLQEQMTDEVEVAVEELLASSEQVAASSQQIGSVAADQASNLDDLSGEIERLSATVEEIAASAEEVNRKSDDTEDLAVESYESAEETLKPGAEAAGAGDRLTENTRDLRSRVDEIGGIVHVIDDIADQTNLLALNASIEAARTESGGEGFAVVADEIKTLAEQSKEEAGEIEGIVSDITGNIESTAENVEEANERIDAAVDQIETLMDNQQRILEAISETSVGMDEIAAATDEQSTTAEEVSAMINDAVLGVNEVSSEIEELATANERQTEKVRAIKESVGRIEAHLAETAGE